MLLVFNIAGYRLLYSFLETRETQKLEAKIDQGNYNEAELIEIKIPLNMPYVSDKGFEVAYGETNFEGKVYRYVKRKISNNTLHLLCIPHKEKTALLASRSALDKNNASGNSPAEQSKKSDSVVKLTTAEFLPFAELTNVNELSVHNISDYSLFNMSHFSAFTPLTEEQPPEI